VREIFCDSSGYGRPGEPATTAQFLINEELKVGLAYSIGDQGQFQVYVNEWMPGHAAMQKALDQHEAKALGCPGQCTNRWEGEP
jgi:hypothetical protein